MTDTIDLTRYGRFKITGTDRQGRRIPTRESDNFFYLRCFNYWAKTMWGQEKTTGKWRRLYRVTN